MPNELTEEEIDLKTNGEKIILNLDNCEVKANDYYEDITNKGLALIDIDAYKEQYIVQSVIIYYFDSNGVSEKFISDTFLIDAITLEAHILNNEIVLYVNKFDRNKYFFDFNPASA